MPDQRDEDIDVIDRAAGLAPGDALHAARRFRAKVVEATQASHDALLQQPVDGLSTEDRLRVAAHVCAIAGATSLSRHYDVLLAAAPGCNEPPSLALPAMLDFAAALTTGVPAREWSRLYSLRANRADYATSGSRQRWNAGFTIH